MILGKRTCSRGRSGDVMPAVRRSFPEPPGQSTVRVLNTVEGVTLTNQPDPERVASDRNSGNPGPVGSCLLRVFKGIVVLLLVFGVVLVTPTLIGTVFFDRPMMVNGRPAGKLEAVFALAGFLAMWVSISAVLLFVAGKIFPGPKRYWRLVLGDDHWVLRQGNSWWVACRVSPREIEGLAVDRRGRVVAATTAGKRRAITGPLSPFESAWAVRALSGLLGQSSGAGRISDSTIYACVPTVDPAASPASTLKYRLSRSDRPWTVTLGCLAITLLWNGITWFFVWVHLSDGDRGFEAWMGWLLLTFFILVGVVAVALSVFLQFQAINDTRAGRAVVEVSMNPLEPGEQCKVFSKIRKKTKSRSRSAR